MKNNFLKKLLCGFLLVNAMTLSAFATDAQREIRKINPPKLDEAHLGKKIICHRPMRHGTPNMTVEKIGSKVVVNNYGHGGSGWTLGPGSANYVMGLLEKSVFAKNLEKNTPITIIGAGALGLFSAYDLLQKGYSNLTLVSERFENLTSHNAGGLLAPVSMDNDPELQIIINKIGIDAYGFFEKIAKKQHPDFKNGAIIVPTYFKDRETSGLEPYVGQVMQPAKDVLLDFGNGTQREMVAYDDGIFIDTAKMMDALTGYVKKRVKFVQKKVTNFGEIQDSYIINCSGMGAKELSHDKKMISIQGHLVMLKDQNPADINHMILAYFDEARTTSDQKVKRSFYIFPKRFTESGINDVGVIGGTFIENADHTTPNEEEFDIMLNGARAYYGLPQQ